MKDDIFISKLDGATYVCCTNGKKLLVDDPDLLNMSKDNLVDYFRSLNVFGIENKLCNKQL